MRFVPTTRKYRFALGGLLVALLLGAGVAGAGMAYAHDRGDGERGESLTVEERLEKLDEALADGEITEERAAEIRERVEAREERRAARDAARQELADLFGMTSEEMHDALHDGSTLADLAADAGVDVADVAELLTNQAEARLDEAVASGKITEERATEIRDGLAERIEAKINGEFEGEGRGHRGRPHAKRGFGGKGHHSDMSDSADA